MLCSKQSCLCQGFLSDSQTRAVSGIVPSGLVQPALSLPVQLIEGQVLGQPLTLTHMLGLSTSSSPLSERQFVHEHREL